MIIAAELQPFCSTDEARPYLHKPWTRDGYTYATDGRIMIKVPALLEVPKNPKGPNCEKLLVHPDVIAQVDLAPLPSFELSPPETIDCDAAVSITLFGAIYNAKYIRRIMALPGLKFSTSPPPDGPATRPGG